MNFVCLTDSVWPHGTASLHHSKSPQVPGLSTRNTKYSTFLVQIQKPLPRTAAVLHKPCLPANIIFAASAAAAAASAAAARKQAAAALQLALLQPIPHSSASSFKVHTQSRQSPLHLRRPAVYNAHLSPLQPGVPLPAVLKNTGRGLENFTRSSMIGCKRCAQGNSRVREGSVYEWVGRWRGSQTGGDGGGILGWGGYCRDCRMGN